MATRITVVVQEHNRRLFADDDGPDKWEFNVTRSSRKAAVVAVLCAFVKQYDGELEEASRDLFHALDALKPILQKPQGVETEGEEAPK